MARPVCIRDGDPYVLVLIKRSGSQHPISHSRFPERRSIVRPFHFHHRKLVSPSRRVSALGRSLELRCRRRLHVESLATPDHRPGDPRQLGGERHHHRNGKLRFAEPLGRGPTSSSTDSRTGSGVHGRLIRKHIELDMNYASRNLGSPTRTTKGSGGPAHRGVDGGARRKR